MDDIKTKKSKKLKRPLRSGYTTGACAAAAAKAAAQILLLSGAGLEPGGEVEIPLPGGKRAHFKLHKSKFSSDAKRAWASVIKDAGDDPDVTNGAEVSASVIFTKDEKSFQTIKGGASVVIKGGEGVGVVTRPGLPVAIGQPAINPVPRRMITEAVLEATLRAVEVTISVAKGEVLAKKTLNARLGIVGGISILGTTGIVKPLSGAAWKATIQSSMKVARAIGLQTVALSSGRTSERAHMQKFKLPEPSYVLMGDYVEYSLKEAARQKFGQIHICAQWAKLIKIAMGTPDTHVRSGVIDANQAADFLRDALGIKIPVRPYNTAREMFDYVSIRETKKVCAGAAAYGERISGLPVTAFLVSYEGKIIADNE